MNMQHALEALNEFLDENIPAFLWGAPGLGKSDIVRQAATARGIGLIDLRAVQLDPVDLRGVPSIVNSETCWNPPKTFPNVKRDGANGILFLDELNAAPLMVQAGLFQLVLDRCLGDYVLPDGWRIVAAGNRQSDKAAAQRLPSALGNRFAHIDCEADVESFCAWASKNGIAPEIIAFVRFRPGLLHNMETQDLRAFPTPRAWSQVSKIIGKKHATPSQLVGIPAGAEFMGFLDIYKNLPSLAAIFASPDTVKVPDEISAKFALAAAIGRAITHSNIGAAAIYLQRMSPEFSTMGMLDAIKRDVTLKETAAFVQWAIGNSINTL